MSVSSETFHFQEVSTRLMVCFADCDAIALPLQCKISRILRMTERIGDSEEF
jgi:hypothetical protein